jgi:hypothetical protein
MGNYGIISSINSLPVPEGLHVRDFDERQKASKQAARVAAKAKDAAPPTGETTVMRQMSPNLSALPTVTSSALQSVADLVDAYKTTDKAIAACTAQFVSKAAEAKKTQDDILPHLAFMQSLLSKKGINHSLIIEARESGQDIPWWTDYYQRYQDRLWESLRTMQRRIAKYRTDPSLPPPPPPDPGLQLRKSDRKALIDAASIGVEIVTALEQGGDPSPFISQYKQVVTRKRLDDILHVDHQETEEDRFKETLNRIRQNHSNEIKALANKLAGMVIDKKPESETISLAKRIMVLYQQFLQPGFFEEKAKRETSPAVAVGKAKPEVKSKRDSIAASKLEQAEAWLRRYLKNGPMPIPESYRKHGLCRYNYPSGALPPSGIGKRTIDKAIINLGVQKLPSGPRGGIRWHLPTPRQHAE